MKRLKLYEQFEIGDLSEEEIFGKPDPNKGPYDDILEYGEDGPDFKAGDRVICESEFDDNFHIVNKIGTVLRYANEFFIPHYLVCFDDDVSGHNHWLSNAKPGHCWYVTKECLKKNMRKLKLYEQFIDFEDFSEEEIFGKMNRNILLTRLNDDHYFLQKIVGEKIYLFDNLEWTTSFNFKMNEFEIIELTNLKIDASIYVYDKFKKYGGRRLPENLSPNWTKLNKNEVSQVMINEILKDRYSLDILL